MDVLRYLLMLSKILNEHKILMWTIITIILLYNATEMKDTPCLSSGAIKNLELKSLSQILSCRCDSNLPPLHRKGAKFKIL